MVKRLRDQSAEKPSRRICPRMVWPVVSYHWFTRRSQASRPIASLLVPFLANCFSRTFCVAMAAWSVPGTQSAASPSIRCQRIRTSCKVYIACPMCRSPVMFGGGIEIAKVLPVRLSRALKYPRCSQVSYQRCSTAFGSYRVSTVGTVYVLSLPRLRGRAGWGPLQRRLARRIGSRAVFGVGYRRLLDAGRFRELGQEDGRAHRQQRLGDDFVHGLDELERQPLADVGWDVSQIGLVVGR